MPTDHTNLIWYIRASQSNGDEIAQGSAVAIRLRNQSSIVKTYLLTCSHCLRSKSKDGKRGLGSPFDEIKVWPPNSGDGDDAGMAVQVCSQVRQLEDRDLEPSERKNFADDWVLLEFTQIHSLRQRRLPSTRFAIRVRAINYLS